MSMRRVQVTEGRVYTAAIVLVVAIVMVVLGVMPMANRAPSHDPNSFTPTTVTIPRYQGGGSNLP